jgi:hypothetical protein
MACCIAAGAKPKEGVSMNTIYYDSVVSDDLRRQMLYQGQLFVYSARPSTIEFCDFSRKLIEEAFRGFDPQTAQEYIPVEKYAQILGELKPKFIHHEKSKECIQALLRELGCDIRKTYFDVPRMRSSTSGGYLTSGIAYAWHPHRDTWYSAPACQINWWIPIYGITSDNAMAFHHRYWTQAVRNDSFQYDYEEWNKHHRYAATQFIKEDPRPLPRATEPIELDPQVRLICPAGGIILFSGAQMHSSVPNTSGHTRFSIDFRTVHLDDVVAFRGAPNIDSACTGTTMNDYLRGNDLEHVPEEIVTLYRERAQQTNSLPGNSR